MSWGKLDDSMAFHRKILAAGNEAVGAWARMISHSCFELTDGRIARATALVIAPPKVLRRLLDTGLLEELDGGDYQVHDFGDWNPPAAEVKAKRESDRLRKEAARSRQGRDSHGRIQSARSSEVVRADNQSDVHSDTSRTPDGVTPVPSPSPYPERENPPPLRGDPHGGPALGPDENPEWGLSSEPPARTTSVMRAAEKQPRRRPETDCPASAEDPTAWLAQWGLPSPTSDPEVQRFLDHHRSKGNRMRDWGAAWRKWKSGAFVPASATRLRVVQQAAGGPESESFWERKAKEQANG